MLDRTFAALADPTRRAILSMLAESDLSVGDLVEQFPIAQSAVSRHLNTLEEAGLIERRRDGQRRICSLKAESLVEVDEWISVYRVHWKKALRRLDGMLQARKRP